MAVLWPCQANVGNAVRQFDNCHDSDLMYENIQKDHMLLKLA